MHYKIAVLGHSIVRDLASIGPLSHSLSDRDSYETKFFAIPGSCYRTWLDWPPRLHSAIEYKPDIVFICLGSNSIRPGIEIKELIFNARIFLKKLRANLEHSKVVPCQIETRFLSEFSSRGNPSAEIFRRLRNTVNKALQSNKTKDYLCMISGPGRLDNESLYREDKIHLNTQGLIKYRSFIHRTIRFIVDREHERNRRDAGGSNRRQGRVGRDS